MAGTVASPPKEGERPAPPAQARYAAVGVLLALFAFWWYAMVQNWGEGAPPHIPVHSFYVPLVGTTLYLVALPVLFWIGDRLPWEPKLLLEDTVFVYNAAQVFVNVWMVFTFMKNLATGEVNFIGDFVTQGSVFAVWIHYTDKYLEFLDTFFMCLRGKRDQVSFLHVYHHWTITWAWWIALTWVPGGDSYFGAMCNSIIHIMMYAYYAAALKGIAVPWKQYITVCQLIQFITVVVYSLFSSGSIWYQGNLSLAQGLCYCVQVFEMVSLFALFQVFFKKKYKKVAQKAD